MAEVNADREAHGKPPFDSNDGEPPKMKKTTKSTTDPESGMFHKGEHKKSFAYEAHTVCDKHNFVLEVEVTGISGRIISRWRRMSATLRNISRCMKKN